MGAGRLFHVDTSYLVVCPGPSVVLVIVFVCFFQDVASSWWVVDMAGVSLPSEVLTFHTVLAYCVVGRYIIFGTYIVIFCGRGSIGRVVTGAHFYFPTLREHYTFQPIGRCWPSITRIGHWPRHGKGTLAQSPAVDDIRVRRWCSLAIS